AETPVSPGGREYLPGSPPEHPLLRSLEARRVRLQCVSHFLSPKSRGIRFRSEAVSLKLGLPGGVVSALCESATGGTAMSDAVRGMGRARVQKVEEICGPGFKPNRMFPRFEREAFEAQKHWMVPEHVEAGSDRLIGSIHTWVLRTPQHTILIDTCLGNHKT